MVSMATVAKDLFGDKPNPDTKDLSYYEIYDKYLSEQRSSFTHIAEIGVYSGESLKVLSRYFSKAKILGVDIERKDIDFGGFDNITYVQCDQADSSRLGPIADGFSESGFDLIIDDASHIGYYSLKTFNIMFSKLKLGGFYVIEDWGTGYWDDFPDGSRYQSYGFANFDGRIPKRLPSHDYGMVGLVKLMVDIVGMGDIRPSHAEETKRVSPFDYIHFYHGMAVIKKRCEYSFELELAQEFGPANGVATSSLETRNRYLEAEIGAIRSSRSWRIAERMRTTGLAIRRLLGRTGQSPRR
jgi:hypothetical protein